MLLITNLEEPLKELDGIVRKYQGLERRERRIWNQLRLASEDLGTVRGKLTFHVNAINAFTSSLSRGTLAQIETVLLELVGEVRQGRRRPSLISLHETNNDSVWRELESELAGDGISTADVVKHKDAIKVFVQGLLSDANADTTSLIELASLMEPDNNGADSELSPHLRELWPENPAEPLTVDNAEDATLAPMDGEENESADEELPLEDAGASSPIVQSRRTKPNFDDACAFVKRIQTQFIRQRGFYYQFLDILKYYNEKIFNTSEAINWISTLFICHPELIQEFNIFLPPGHRIECGTVDSHYAFRVIMPFTAYIRIPDLQAMSSSLTVGETGHFWQLLVKWIDPASLNILRPYPTVVAPLDWTTGQPVSSAFRVRKASRTFLDRFRAFLARLKATEEAATKKNQSDERNGITHVSDHPELAIRVGSNVPNRSSHGDQIWGRI